MKPFIAKNIAVYLFLILLFGCTSVDNNENLDQIEFPSAEKIKSDLLTKKVDQWRFDDLNEFESFNIISNTLSEDKKSLTINCQADLIGIYTSKKLKAELIINYTLLENNSWEFESVDGTMDEIENSENSVSEENIDPLNVPESRIAPDNYDYSENNTEETEKNNNKTKYTKCQWCNTSFEITLEKVKTVLGVIECWEGGTNFCNENDKNEQKKRTDQALDYIINGFPVNKYCSKKCACDAYYSR